MTLRLDAEGVVVSSGDQVGVDKARYVSLCRKHWREALEGKPGAATGEE